MLAARRADQRPQAVIRSIELPAPVGGINAVSPATALPPGDCLLAFNMTPAELGQRVRQGWSEWAVGLTGVSASDLQVRTVIPFSGARKNGSTDKLFATTTTGIWDVSNQGAVTSAWTPSTSYVTGSLTNGASFVTNGGNTYVCTVSGTSATSGGPTGTGSGIVDGTCQWNFLSGNVVPVQVVTFGTQTGDAGYGNFTVMINGSQGDHTLLYCDEENGYYVYSETSGTWAKVTQGAGANQISGVDPATFVACTVWKNRTWFVARDSTVAWFTGVNAMFGTVQAFDFGPRFRAGGILTQLYSWSYDAGQGMDTLLVGISSGGDIVIYQGTDPSSASTFSIKGCWSVGGVPYGRHLATDFGGELLIMSLNGVVQASKLIQGAPATVGSSAALYDSAKIFPLFSQDAQTFLSNKGWMVSQNPGDNCIEFLVPANGSGFTAKVYVLSRTNKAWSIYRDQPKLSMAVWNGTAYFGTPDGRVAKVGGYVDGVLFGNTTAFSSINWSVLTGFTDEGNLNQKSVKIIQPILEAQEPNPPINAVAKYNGDMTEAAPPTAASSSSGVSTLSTWDNAVWDRAIWGGSYSEVAPIIGGSGMGRRVAVAVAGKATTRTALVGIGLGFIEGGNVL